MKSKPTKKKVEPTKPIHEPEKGKSSGYQYDDYFDLFQYKLRPISPRFLEILSKEYLDWAMNDQEAFKVSQFFIRKGIPPTSFHRWCKDNEDMRRAHEIVIMALGNRRELGAIKKDYDSGMIRHMMPQYDKEWREIQEWQAKMKLENEGQGGTQIVVIEKTPDSELVPSKLTPEEVAGRIRKKIGSGNFNPGEHR